MYGVEPKLITFIDISVKMRLVQQASSITNIFGIHFKYFNPHTFAFVVLTFRPFIRESEYQLHQLSCFETFTNSGSRDLTKLFVRSGIIQVKTIVFEHWKRMVFQTHPGALLISSFGCPATGQIVQFPDAGVEFKHMF